MSLLLVAATFNLSSAQSQRSCGTMQHLQMQLQSDPKLTDRMQQIENKTQQIISSNTQNKTAAIITIPVVVHVVYKTSAQNISDAQVQSQIDVLNEDFSKLNADASLTPSVYAGLAVNCQIQFCLAKRDPNGLATNGIDRKSTTTTSFSSNDAIKSATSATAGGANAWNSTQYLNLWSGNLSGGLLGYAQFPGGTAATDGVVILYSAFGRVGTVSAPYNKGRTATHEVGHWLNLRHIWGDANCGSDLVTDTPTQQTSNFGCPTFPHITCSNVTGDMSMNYMDYTDDACMYMFSAGQSSRMSASISASRAGLLSSQGCVPVTTVCGVPAGLASSGVTTTAATISWGAASNALSYKVQYRIVGAASWTATTSTTTSKALSGLTSASNYEFQVQTVCSSGSSAFSTSGTFTTATVSTTCNVPASLASSAITSSTATISWGAAIGANSYNVQYRIVGAASWLATTSTTTSKALTGLTASSNYEFQVQTVCSAGSSAFSASGLFTTSAVSTGCSDIYEPNASTAAAATIPVNTNIVGLIAVSGDNDYYKFVTTAGLTNIKVILSSLPADFDLKLYNSSGTTLTTSQNAGTTSEQIILNTTTAATYYLRVYGYSSAYSATSCYNLIANTSGSTFRTANQSTNEGSSNALKVNGIDELSIYPNPTTNKLNINFFITESATLTTDVIDMLGKTVLNKNFSVDEGFNQTALDLSDLNNGIYFLRLQQNDQIVVKKFIVKH